MTKNTLEGVLAVADVIEEWRLLLERGEDDVYPWERITPKLWLSLPGPEFAGNQRELAAFLNPDVERT